VAEHFSLGQLKSMDTNKTSFKRWIFCFVGILILIGSQLDQDKNQNTIESSNSLLQQMGPFKPLTTAVTIKLPPFQPVRNQKRFPASIPQRDYSPKTAIVTLGKKPIRIGKNFNVVDGVSTVTKAKYKPSLGKKIFENGQYVFFKPVSAKTEAWPVALSSTNLKLYPISHILNVKGVDANTREQFKAEGMHEYYYQPRMQLIFLEATPATVLKQYRALTARGFDVRLEVIKETPRAN
jgi:hypothetical protein